MDSCKAPRYELRRLPGSRAAGRAVVRASMSKPPDLITTKRPSTSANEVRDSLARESAADAARYSTIDPAKDQVPVSIEDYRIRTEKSETGAKQLRAEVEKLRAELASTRRAAKEAELAHGQALQRARR